MKIEQVNIATTTIVAMATAFMGVAGYISSRAQAHTLGLSRDALSTSFHYVLEAAEFGMALIALILLASAAAVVFALAHSMLRQLAPRAAAKTSGALFDWIGSASFATTIVLGTVATAVMSAWAIDKLHSDQALGILQKAPHEDASMAGVFMLVGLLLLGWGLLVLGPASSTFRQNWHRRKWLWRLAIPALVVLSIILPFAHGAGLRERKFVSLRVHSAGEPDKPKCGLLIGRNDSRVAFWTAAREGEALIGMVADIPLEGSTLELGPLASLKARINEMLIDPAGNSLCSLTASRKSGH